MTHARLVHADAEGGTTIAARFADVLNPRSWGETLSGAPVLDAAVGGMVPALVRRWCDIVPDISQPALDQHYLSVHMGGAKRLIRRGEGGCRSRDVSSGAYSVVPAGAAFEWRTEGPIDFIHIYFDLGTVEHVIAGAFDRDPSRIVIEECLGNDDLLLQSLALALVDEVSAQEPHRAYLDDLLHLLLCRLLRKHSNARTSAVLAPHALAPFRLSRALDFIESNLGAPIGVGEIAAATGISRFHFSRAFRHTTGRSPYAYLIDRRVVSARAQLTETDKSLARIAQDCGFASVSQFSRMFRRATGAAPGRYRRQY